MFGIHTNGAIVGIMLILLTVFTFLALIRSGLENVQPGDQSNLDKWDNRANPEDSDSA